jgi:hypothetical protein
VDQFQPGQATVPNLLTAQEPLANLILMNDEFNFWSATQGYGYSHGFNGARSDDPSANHMDYGPPNNLAGLNELYGDGRVAWKSANEMNTSAISPYNSSIGMVRGYSTDSEFY